MQRPATPANKRLLDLSLQSTPLSRGTAANAEHSEDSRSTSATNKRLVKEDLESKSTANIIPFLKAILARILLYLEGTDLGEDPVFHKNLIEKRDGIFDKMLDEALTFCNNKEGENWVKLKENLQAYCNERLEAPRYLPLSNALNTILIEFGDRIYGSIPSPNEREGKEQIIYSPNDPTVIQSKHLYGTGNHKPDIVGMHLSTLCELYPDHEDADFKDMAANISGSMRMNEKASRTPEWREVQQAWELKSDGKTKLKLPDHQWSKEEIMCLENQSSVKTNLKRVHVDVNNDSPAAKKSLATRLAATQSARPSIRPLDAPPLDPLDDIDDNSQCAFYGIDRLTAIWTILYSTVLLLQDSMLSLRWYDAQGCIESEFFDFLDQLPIFIVMIVIFQRFDSYMWGISQKDDTTVEVAGRKFYLSKERLPFQLKGRRVGAMFAEPVPDNPQDAEIRPIAENMTKFFKCAWRERVRDPEYKIIKVSDDRVTTLLPEKFRGMVRDHLPKVIASQECSKENTATIRVLLQQAVSGSENINREDTLLGARVWTWMVSERLQHILHLSPPDFLRVYFDSMRCHYLLWRMGIAHSDISLNNLMCTKRNGRLVGILNDYDLASIMKPGDRNPEKKGRERTGSIPFMAMDLLKYTDGEQMRWYRHDLESFLWCLLWRMMDHPPTSWLDNGFSAVLSQKNTLFDDVPRLMHMIKSDWIFAEEFVVSWIMWLSDSSKEKNRNVIRTLRRTRRNIRNTPEATVIQIKNHEDTQTKDSEHIRLVTEYAGAIDCFADIPALRDNSWVDVVLEVLKE